MSFIQSLKFTRLVRALPRRSFSSHFYVKPPQSSNKLKATLATIGVVGLSYIWTSEPLKTILGFDAKTFADIATTTPSGSRTLLATENKTIVNVESGSTMASDIKTDSMNDLASRNIATAETAVVSSVLENSVEADPESLVTNNLKTPPTPLPPTIYRVPYVLIGAGTAAHFAVTGILERDPHARVLMIGDDTERPYARPPLSKELWFQDNVSIAGSDGNAVAAEESQDDLTFLNEHGQGRSLSYADATAYITLNELTEQTPEQATGGIALLSQRKVIDLDPLLKRVLLDDGDIIFYDKCLIATGSHPKTLPMFENAATGVKENILFFRTPNDYKTLLAAAETAESIAVIGGGLLGCEMAVALQHHSEKRQQKQLNVNTSTINAGNNNRAPLVVHCIFPEKGLLPTLLPAYLSQSLSISVQQHGVKVHSESTVEAISQATTDTKGVVLTLANGSTLTVDKVLVAIGSTPNTLLAKGARLEVASDANGGGIMVNAELAARSDIWVAGDVANFYDISLGRRRIAHHDHAAVSGRLAGRNMTGERKPYFQQAIFYSELGPKISFEAIGTIDASLPTVSVWGAPGSPAGKDCDSSSAMGASPTLTLTEKSGVIFYMQEKKVVGIVLWNTPNSITIARKIIRSEKHFENVKELARLFPLH